MAVTKVKKIRIVSHHDSLDTTIAALQGLGCCEIIPPDGESRPEGGLGSTTPERIKPGRSSELETCISDCRFLLRFLEPLYAEKGGTLERLLGPKPPVTLTELASLRARTDLPALSSKARNLERSISEMRSETGQIANQLHLLEPIKELGLPLWVITRGTEKVMGVMGSIPTGRKASLAEHFSSVVNGEGELFLSSSTAKETEAMAVLIFPRVFEQEVMESAAKAGFSRIDCPPVLEEKPAKEIERLAKRRGELAEEIASAEDEASRMATEVVPVVRNLSDYLAVLAARNEAGDSGVSSEKVSVLWFWIPAGKIKDVEKALEPCKGLVDIYSEDPSPEDNPPILLENPRWAIPFSPLTKLYGMPSYSGIDPTVLMAPFFFLFFGMCLGDGGYGLVLGAFLLYALLRYRLSGDTKNFFVLLLLGSISTVLVGALTGSWLGDMIDVFGIFAPIKSLKDSLVLIKPMDDPITFLAIALGLGVVQILFGILIAFWDAFRKGDMMGAFADQGGWLALLVGFLLWGASSLGVGGGATLFSGKALAAVGALTLVATQGRDKPGVIRKVVSGVLSLYNVTSYLGDVLSYSRLLALGLATSAIAMIGNTLTILVSGIPYVGWVLAFLIFFGGHLFSVVVNVLGSFIHSLRLQYVEFFSKFYSAGGRAFNPLRVATKFTRITGQGVEGPGL
ncbi:MAG: V-type ATP synthase subunit I [Synergistaceae bacterium]|nr:V-type ATP synthase subunit I [Synergistaceae bacterium]